MAAEFDDIDDLLAALQRDLDGASAFSIGIDGIDGAGKTALGKRVAVALGIPLVSLDISLKENLGTYVEHLEYDEIARLISSERIVIEGVCLLEVAEKLNLALTRFVYVKRYGPYGDWRDMEECDPQGPVDDLLARLDQEAKAFAKIAASLEGSNSASTDGVALTPFRREIINYHARYRPTRRADYELHVYPDGRLPADAYLTH